MAVSDSPSALFSDPTSALHHLEKLQDDFVASGSQYSLQEFAGMITTRLSVSPDPDMVLTNLLRFSEATFSKSALFNDLLHYPVMADVLCTVFGSSQYFSDILVRDTSLFHWLTTSPVLTEPITTEYLRHEITRIEETFASPARRLDALKRLHRRELVRIGTQDVLGLSDLARVTLSLSKLADSLIDAALHTAELELTERFGRAPRTPYAVIGLGKLGGNELNYSSDIDLLFVYQAEGMIRGEKRRPKAGPADSVSHHEYFNALTELLVRTLSQPTAEGYLYRVDTRLRPESGAGPLARSERSYLAYYESRGEIWERQMFLKARPVAGDPGLATAFLEHLRPFISPRTFFQRPADYVARIKARIERSVGDEANVKLMPGGIRDIEFVVQTLQLVNGGVRPEILDGNTLSALRKLAAAGYLTGREEERLREAYTFYRRVEHRLQTALNTQTHVLPSDTRSATILARRLGLASAKEFQDLLDVHLRSVRAIFDQVLSSSPSMKEEGILPVLDGTLSGEHLAQVFRSFGFRDDRLALRNVKVLSAGSALTEERVLDGRARDAFRAIAQVLFGDIAATPDPDMTLSNVASIAAAQKFPRQFYEQLSDTGFRRFLLDVCKASPRFARGLAQDPLLLETLASSISSLEEEPAFTPGHTPLVRYKNREEVRLGVRFILGFCDFALLTRDLSRLADAVLMQAIGEEIRRRRLSGTRYACFALGKYGSREMNFDGDLDLLFVSQTRTPAEASRFQEAAAALVSRLSSVSEDGKLYEVDTRLRPEGKNAPLVADAEGYVRYLTTRASLWERQMLTRIRPVIGDGDLVESMMKSIDTFVYEMPLPPGWVDAIVSMRRKMETRKRFSGPVPIDVKIGEGGMADVEFLAQMMQLRFGREVPALRGLRRIEEILGAQSRSLLKVDERTELLDSYREYRNIETVIRITLAERSTLLPEAEKLNTLGRFLSFPDGEALRAHVSTHMRRTRSHFLTVARRLSA